MKPRESSLTVCADSRKMTPTHFVEISARGGLPIAESAVARRIEDLDAGLYGLGVSLRGLGIGLRGLGASVCGLDDDC